MVRGSEQKQFVTDKILATFEGAFIGSDGKTIRIPFSDCGEAIEIKCALTTANNLEGGCSTVEKSAFPTVELSKPTAEELETVNRLLNSF